MIMAHKAPSGEIAFLSTMVRDITERKQIEQAQAGAVSDSRARAHDATGLLCHLVDDILDIEKLESGAMDFAFEEVDLVLLVEHAVRVNRVYAARFGVEFELVGSRSGLRVWADGGRLMQVLTNLFSNAAKFSHSDNTAEVRVKRVGSTARVSVSNYGEPIPDHVRAELFEKFVQARSKEKPRTGTGMGLAISKAIVAHHSGRIVRGRLSPLAPTPDPAAHSAFASQLPCAKGAGRSPARATRTPSRFEPSRYGRSRIRHATPQNYL